MLWRSRPSRTANIGNWINVIETQNPKKPVALKFSYAGNTQYHQLTGKEADALISELNSIRNKGSN
jgi:hypothetical protein